MQLVLKVHKIENGYLLETSGGQDEQLKMVYAKDVVAISEEIIKQAALLALAGIPKQGELFPVPPQKPHGFQTVVDIGSPHQYGKLNP